MDETSELLPLWAQLRLKHGFADAAERTVLLGQAAAKEPAKKAPDGKKKGSRIEGCDPNTSCLFACLQSCQSGCEGSCQKSCEQSCQTACEQSCQTSCETECQTACEKSCQDSCQRSGCQSACQTSCEVNCQYTCMHSCQDITTAAKASVPSKQARKSRKAAGKPKRRK